MQNLKCSNCGSSDIEVVNDKTICRHCGSSSIISKIEINNITNVSSSNKMQEEKYELKINFDKKTFFKKAMAFLAVNKDIAKDVFDSQFEESTIKYTYISVVDCNCEITYSLDIGIEQKVKQRVKEDYFDKRSKRYKTHYVDKWVTETIWQPYNGKYSNLVKEVSIYDQTLSQVLQEHLKDIEQYIRPNDITFTSEKENFPEIEPSELNRIATSSIKNSSSLYKEFINIKTYKNLNLHDGTGHIGHMVTYKVPIYCLNFNYKGEKCTVYCLANNYNSMVVEGIYDEEKEAFKEKLNKQNNKINNPIKYTLIASSILFSIVALILAFTSLNRVSIYLLIGWFAFNLITYLSSLAINEICDSKFRSNIKNYENSAVEEKKEKCRLYCINQGYSAPSDDEFAEFEQEEE